MAGQKWTPIRPLHEWIVKFDFSEIDSLKQLWLSTKTGVEASTPEAYAAFVRELHTRWSIETGLIEGLYYFDRGITETLVELGVKADYIEQQGTDKNPAEIARTIQDHQKAVVFIDKWIENGLPLSKLFVRTLHSILCANQMTFRAVDQFGRWFNATLKKGEFKTLPNNPKRQDGVIHEYAPPEQVESELDRLIALYTEAERRRYPPLLQAAWLHHAFSAIHPFQDGNGRVARGLLTWQLVKDEFLPIIISRDSRTQYIDALESADRGQLSDLVELFARLEREVIVAALSQSSDDSSAHVFVQVLDGLADRLNRRAMQLQLVDDEVAAIKRSDSDLLEPRSGLLRERLIPAMQLHFVDKRASSLQRRASTLLASRARLLQDHLATKNVIVSARVTVGSLDEETILEFRYRPQILGAANTNGYRVNLNEPRYTVEVIVTPLGGTEIPRLDFVVLLHHTGPPGAGLVVASAFAEVPDSHSNVTAQEGSDGSPPLQFKDCTLEPFTLSWQTDEHKLRDRFDRWVEERMSVALRYWGEFVEG